MIQYIRLCRRCPIITQQEKINDASSGRYCSAGIPLKVLQSLMGHKSISSTKVFALDVAVRHRVQFQMPEADAVAMLKGNI